MKKILPPIDEISKNIIYILSLDSKTPSEKIAIDLETSRRIVDNRIKKLYSDKIIKPLLIFNDDTFKLTILLKLSSFDKDLINSVKKISPLIKLKECLGAYDLSILLACEKEEELQNILNKINKLFNQNIQNMDIITHNFEDTLGYKSFCTDFSLLNYDMLKPNKNCLNEVDKRLLSYLKDNPLISYKELTKQTKMSYKKIKNSILKLLENKIIRFSIDPDYNKLNLEFHNVLVKVNPVKTEEFEKNIISHPRIHWFKKGSGKWNYILSVCATDISEFIDVTRDIRSQNKDIIFDLSAIISKINVMRKF